MRDDALAEDSVQTAFCKIMSARRRDIRAVEHPRAWLATVVRNECRMKLRTDRRAAARAEAHAESAQPPPNQPPADPFELETIRLAVDRLPDHLREIVLLKHTSGLTFDQIAEVTQQNRNTAASRYRDALQKLKAELAPTLRPDPTTSPQGARP